MSHSYFGGDNIRIGIIGAGKVGFTIGKYLVQHNIKLVGYFSKSIESAKEASIFTNSNYFNNIKELVQECDTIIITTPDGIILDIWNEIRKFDISNKIICHCSGSLSSKVFSNIESYNCYGYSIHPMFAISNKYNSYKDLKKAFITVEGSQKHINKIKAFIESLGNKVKIISWENKSEYHLSSVLVSNHVLALINISKNLLINCGFNDEEAIEALYPLIINNINNIKCSGILNSLTGPIERGDVKTVINHMKCLNEGDRELYRLISKKLIDIAKVKNKDKDYRELEEVIGG